MPVNGDVIMWMAPKALPLKQDACHLNQVESSTSWFLISFYLISWLQVTRLGMFEVHCDELIRGLSKRADAICSKLLVRMSTDHQEANKSWVLWSQIHKLIYSHSESSWYEMDVILISFWNWLLNIYLAYFIMPLTTKWFYLGMVDLWFLFCIVKRWY